VEYKVLGEMKVAGKVAGLKDRSIKDLPEE
jgi:hypothetical protein